jgi:uncharacterized membrane protein
MFLRVMTLVGFLVLVLGLMIFWLAPATTSQPRSAKPIGTSAVSHGESSSASRSGPGMDRPDSAGSIEEVNSQRR